MGYPWFFVFVSLVATKTGSRPQYDFCVVGFVFLGFLVGFPICCFRLFSSRLALIQCVVCPKAWFHTFGVAVSIFPGAFHSFQKGLPWLCPFCALCVFLWALVSKNYHLKLICFVSVSSVLFGLRCFPSFLNVLPLALCLSL